MYLDMIDGESVKVLVCADTSGSVDDAELQTFLGEVVGILSAYPHRPPRCPVLWVVPPGGRAAEKFPFGEAVPLLQSQRTPFVGV